MSVEVAALYSGVSKFALLVTLQWRLHFEFVTTTTPIESQSVNSDSSLDSTWQGPSTLDIETMVWDLPISVYPASPLQLIYGPQCKSDVSVCI